MVEYNKKTIQTKMKEIWVQLFHDDNITINDDFFYLGGNSFLAVEFINKIKDFFDVDISLSDLFKNPTIQLLSDFIKRNAQADSLPSLVAKNKENLVLTSYAQQCLLNLNENTVSKAVHIDFFPLHLTGALRIESLREAFIRLIERHEILRTHFKKKDGQWYQVIKKRGELVWDDQTLDYGGQLELEEKLQCIADEFWETPFDLTQGPLFRIKLVRLKAKESVLFITIHQSIFDGWSLGVLATELSQLYNHLAFHAPLRLNELPIQYADYALWQREWLVGDILDKKLNYWEKHLEFLPPEVTIPYRKARPLKSTFEANICHMKLPSSLMNKLKELSKRQSVTLFMTLLASLQILLCKYNALEDMVVGSPISNRTQKEVESLIGLFANMLIFRIKLKKNINFYELLEYTREEVANASMHQEIPFEQVIAQYPERYLQENRHPLFQIMFTLENFAPIEFNFKDVLVEPLKLRKAKTKFDISFNTRELPTGELDVGIGYAAELYNQSEIEVIGSYWVDLLERISQNPKEKIDNLGLFEKNTTT
ncbi:MAG: hypothetical protein J0H87_08295 [Holosporales bacterium]|nr:hypothetical protein [Holosporales bacterium]